MHHHALGHLAGAQYVEGVVPCLARMHDEGQVVLPRQRDLGREGVTLRRSGGVVVVVVETALPHRHHDAGRVGEDVDEDALDLFGGMRCLVGMKAHRRPGFEPRWQPPPDTRLANGTHEVDGLT